MVLASQRVLRPDGGFAPATIHIDVGRPSRWGIDPRAEQVGLVIVAEYVGCWESGWHGAPPQRETGGMHSWYGWGANRIGLDGDAGWLVDVQ